MVLSDGTLFSAALPGNSTLAEPVAAEISGPQPSNIAANSAGLYRDAFVFDVNTPASIGYYGN